MEDVESILDAMSGWHGCWDDDANRCDVKTQAHCDWPRREVAADKFGGPYLLCPCACHPDGDNYDGGRPVGL